MAELIIPLSNADAQSLPLAGGKGAQLATMLRGGLSVPDGFCVSTEAFRRGMDDVLRSAIISAYDGLGGGRVAVRSSATAEDLPDASFAGQQDTFLNVAGAPAVVDAVQACWESLFTERAVAYRRDRGIPDESVAMAVVVQRMVDAEAAGVLFTINPVSGAMDEVVVEAALGLGDKVVSAQVTPDRYRLRRRAPHELIEREGGETFALLTAALLAELAHLGMAAERLLGRAADIEWALAGGRVYLLQARAVTAAGPRLPEVRFGSRWNAEHCKDRLILWGNYNLREVMPYPHTPFSWSLWNFVALPAIAVTAGAMCPEDARNPEQAPSAMDLVDGHVYFNMNVYAGFTGLRPRWLVVRAARAIDAEYAEIVDDILRRDELQPLARPFSVRRVWYSLRHASGGLLGAALGLRSVADARAQMKACEQEAATFAAIDARALTEEQIVALARYYGMENLPRGLNVLAASLPSLPALWLLAWLLERWGLPQFNAALISGVRGNPTMETALAMWDLTEHAGPEVRAIFAKEEISRVPDALFRSEEGRDFLAAMGEFLKRHGHRAMREFDFTCPRWRDDPTFVYETVRNYLSHSADQPTPRQHYDGQVRAHGEAKHAVERALRRRPLRRWLFRRLMRVVEERMPLREAYKFYLLISMAQVRDMLLEVGRRQVARGVLAKADDFFFLSLPEIEKISRGELDTDWVRDQIPIRRREFARHMRTSPPLVVRSDGKPVMKPTVAGEVLRGAGASAGTARGPARILLDLGDGALLRKGEILVAKFTDPGWTPLFLTAGALVMEVGGIISHGAVVAREYGIPAVVAVKDATRILRDGEMIEVDGTSGEVRRLQPAKLKSAST